MPPEDICRWCQPPLLIFMMAAITPLRADYFRHAFPLSRD
jgi:hypothetical protein